MEKLRLSQIAGVTELSLPQGLDGDTWVERIAVSLEKVTPGCLYIALEPETAGVALLQGAAAAICGETGEKRLFSNDPLAALNALAAWYRRRFHTWIIGITGSVGKTTVKEMIHSILETEGRTLKSSWELEGEVGLPLALLELDWSDKNAVLEVDFTHPGNIAQMSRIIRPNAALITCVGTGHLTQCGSREALLREKLSITEGMSPSAPLILNGDDDVLQKAYESLSQELISYGVGNPAADFQGKVLSESLSGSELEIRYYGKKQQLKVPIWGKAGVYSALAAFATGVVAGMDPERIAQSIAAFSPARHRQNVLSLNGVTVLDDTCSASPESMREALRYLGALPAKRRIAVLGEMPDLGETAENAHRAVGRRAAQCGADLICCLGEHAAFTAEEANRMGGTRALAFGDRGSLTTFLQNDHRPGDAVLVKGDRSQRLEEIIPIIWGQEE